MAYFSRLAQGTALALCLPATAAFADLTAADVWADWKAYMTASGYEVSASENTSGGTLTISGLVAKMPFGPEGADGTTRVGMDDIRFVEQGDGTVAIELPETTSVEVQMAPETGEKVDVTVTVTQTDPVMTAAGDPDDLTYDYSATTAALVMDKLTVDGVVIPATVAKVDVKMNDLSYTVQTGVDEMRQIDQRITAASVDYDFAFADPEGEGAFKMKGALQEVVLDGNGVLPLDSDPQDMNAMLDDGLDVTGVITTKGGNYDLSFNGPEGSGTANSTSDGGAFSIAMGPAGLIYDVVQRNVNFNMLVTEFPLPMSFSAAEVGTSFLMPLQKGPEPQDFGMTVSLSELKVSDVIWGLFDPSGQLPRDPATLLVDLSGRAKVLFDFLDPAQAAVLEQTGAAPGELAALTLNDLQLDAAGAKLTGHGSFTFDNSDTVTFDGMPRPLGGIDLSLTGGNGLLDKLVGIGLLPEEQAMGARMMMGLFAVPGDAPDTLSSRIEVNGAGHVLANGQRIR